MAAREARRNKAGEEIQPGVFLMLKLANQVGRGNLDDAAGGAEAKKHDIQGERGTLRVAATDKENEQ